MFSLLYIINDITQKTISNMNRLPKHRAFEVSEDFVVSELFRILQIYNSATSIH